MPNNTIAQNKECRQQLIGLDYGHEYITDVNHVLDIYQYAKDYAGRTAVEIGSFWGNATAALSLAGLRVKSCDPDPQTLSRRQAAAPAAEFALVTGEWELQLPEKYAVVFHDSMHGETIVPEIVNFWDTKLDDDGLLIVHDVDQFNLTNFLARIGNPVYSVTSDAKKRTLGFFWK
jgi:hypothetical protein